MPASQEPEKLVPVSPEQRLVPCPACGETAMEVLLRPDDLAAERRWLEDFHRCRARGGEANAKDLVDFTQSEDTWIVRCRACATILRNPQPTCSALGRRYAGDTYGRPTLEQMADNEASYYADRAREAARWLPEGARILEIGPFVGAFLRAAGSLGWTATGLDIGEETVAFMRSRGLDVVRGDLETADLPEAAFDAVFIWNTFDQLCEPGRTLDAVSRRLKDRGLLVVRVPNGAFESACLDRRRRFPGTRRDRNTRTAQAWNNFLTFPYLAGYTPDSIRTLLARHGFWTEEIGGGTIMPLATEATLPTAAAEESRMKRALARFCTTHQQATGINLHPWLDIIARKT